MTHCSFSSPFKFKAASITLTIVALTGCKATLSSNENSTLESASLDNFSALPSSGCLDPSEGEQEILEFTVQKETEEDSLDSSKDILLTDSGLGHLFLHSSLKECPVEVASLRAESTKNTLGIQSSTSTSFGLNLGNAFQGAKGTLRAYEKLKDGKVIFYFTNGSRRVVSIVKSELLSTKDRIKLFSSHKYRNFVRSRVVTSEVLTPSKYQELLVKLDRLRGENFRKFGAWLATHEVSASLKRKRPKEFVLSSNAQISPVHMGPIFDLLADPKLIFRYLQDLEIDIAKRMAKGDNMEVALEALLTEKERIYKFLPAYILTGKDEISGLTRDKLLRPALFRDFGVDSGSRHGVQIHRIQWNVIMRHMDQLPDEQRKVPAAELFVQFGKGVLLKAGEKTSWSDGWNHLFDSYDDAS